MKVAIVGSRDFQSADLNLILKYIPAECDEIISGGARGIDMLAEQAANFLKIKFVCIQPDYKTFGKIAPIVRNETIVNSADLVLAFWDYKSPGTKNAINRCISNNIPLKIIKIS